jgi:hypothetical protein
MEVTKAIGQAWGDINDINMNVDEYTSIEKDQKISSLDPVVFSKELIQVTEKVKNTAENSTDYTLVIQSTTLDKDGSFKPVTSSERKVSVENQSAAVQAQSIKLLAAQEHPLGIETILSLLPVCHKMTGWDVTCHNLSVTQGMRTPPTGIASLPNCGGIPNCQISFKKVAFDIVVNTTDSNGNGHQDKYIQELTMSPDVPFMSRLLEYCQQALVPTNTQKVLVKICNRVQNYQAGKTN